MEELKDDLCFILDLEGFFLNWTFHVRELACYIWNGVQELERQRQTNCEFCEKKDTWIDLSTSQG